MKRVSVKKTDKNLIIILDFFPYFCCYYYIVYANVFINYLSKIYNMKLWQCFFSLLTLCFFYYYEVLFSLCIHHHFTTKQKKSQIIAFAIIVYAFFALFCITIPVAMNTLERIHLLRFFWLSVFLSFCYKRQYFDACIHIWQYDVLHKLTHCVCLLRLLS